MKEHLVSIEFSIQLEDNKGVVEYVHKHIINLPEIVSYDMEVIESKDLEE